MSADESAATTVSASLRKGSWMLTASGHQVWPLDPRPGDVRIEDVAHHLANICRFGGACRTHYSVAEHSVRASYVGESVGLFPLARLLHDVPEYVLGDLVRPLKRGGGFESYIEAEARWADAVCEAFGLPLGSLDTTDVHHADAVMLMTEKRDLMPATDHPWGFAQAGDVSAAPLVERIAPWSAAKAHYRFLKRYYELVGSACTSGHLRAVVSRTRRP